MVWREKESSKIRAVRIDTFMDSLGIRRINIILDARLRAVWVKKWVDERIDDSVLQWLVHVERMGNSWNATKCI